MTPHSLNTGVNTQEIRPLEQTATPSPILQVSWFSICHPIYHENTMYLATRHAIYSAALSTEATATFMFLPSWNKRMTTSRYASLYRKFPHQCKFLGSIPSDQLQYAEVPFWNNIQTPLPKHTWKVHIIAIWNTKGRNCLSAVCLQQKLAKRACHRIPWVKWIINSIQTNRPLS